MSDCLHVNYKYNKITGLDELWGKANFTPTELGLELKLSTNQTVKEEDDTM